MVTTKEKYNQLKSICNAFLISKITKAEFVEQYVEITDDKRHEPQKQTIKERKAYMKKYLKEYNKTRRKKK